ncbi:MAG: hypothetical protein AAF958_10790 [Planctomycetota bacterium]
MIRLPQPWTKKRGSRTLASPTSGIVGEFIGFATVMMVGIFGLSLLIAWNFAPTQIPQAVPEIPGSRRSGGVGFWVCATIFASATLVGAGRLAYRLVRESASHEYRNRLASRATGLPQQARRWLGPPPHGGARQWDAQDSARGMPAVPGFKTLTDSPGEHLRFRLAPMPTTQNVFSLAVLPLLWNAIWFVLLGIAASGIFHGHARPVLTLLLIPLGWVGWRLFRGLLAELRRNLGVGSTIVEISDHPLRAGGDYELLVIQMGRMDLRSLQIRLVCEEETFFRQGTDIRVERHEAVTTELISARKIQVDPSAPWRQQLRFTLSENAMHSMVSPSNAIRWKIVVSGDARRWPSFCRSFPVVVHPNVAGPNPSPR